MPETQPDRLPEEFYEQPLTARMLDDFSRCPRKFLLSFFVTDDQERRLRAGSAALHQAVRLAVLDLHQRGGPGVRPVSELREAFDTHWDGSWCIDSLEEQQLHRAGLEMLDSYHSDVAAAPADLVATDLRMTSEQAGYRYLAVADLVLAPAAGGLDVIRLVTSRRPLSTNELAADLSTGLLHLLANEHFADSGGAVRVWVHALRQRRRREVALDAAQAGRLRHEVSSLTGRLHRESEFPPRRGDQCRWCRSRSGCPAWRR